MANKPKGQLVGVDVGGTFTDLVMLDPATQKVSLAKYPLPTTIRLLAYWLRWKKQRQISSNIDLIIHGTTTTTNAVLERKLSKTGLITTKGFRDILELAAAPVRKPME